MLFKHLHFSVFILSLFLILIFSSSCRNAQDLRGTNGFQNRKYLEKNYLGDKNIPADQVSHQEENEPAEPTSRAQEIRDSSDIKHKDPSKESTDPKAVKVRSEVEKAKDAARKGSARERPMLLHLADKKEKNAQDDQKAVQKTPSIYRTHLKGIVQFKTPKGNQSEKNEKGGSDALGILSGISNASLMLGTFFLGLALINASIPLFWVGASLLGVKLLLSQFSIFPSYADVLSALVSFAVTTALWTLYIGSFFLI